VTFIPVPTKVVLHPLVPPEVVEAPPPPIVTVYVAHAVILIDAVVKYPPAPPPPPPGEAVPAPPPPPPATTKYLIELGFETKIGVIELLAELLGPVPERLVAVTVNV
jgi:hypothetical protein